MANDLPNAFWPGWETGELIGRGSFGAVYEIHRQIFDIRETAALKVISIPQNASEIEEMYEDGYDDESITSTFHSHLKNIIAEYSLMRQMSGNANIVNCDDVRYSQHDDGIGWDIFIKMELLKPLVKSLPEACSEQTVVKVATDICSALELCRQHNIIHRDIKPQNIFVSKNGNYKLGDFGIAKTVEMTSFGTKIGTYKYMAPEVYNNMPYGHTADIYSLGLVLYWMLNQYRLPFLPLPPAKINMSIDEEAKKRRLEGEALPEPKHGSKELKAIVLKACAYKVEDRYGTAAEMLTDLNKLAHSMGIVAPIIPVASDHKIAPIEYEEKTVGIFYKTGPSTAHNNRGANTSTNPPDDAEANHTESTNSENVSDQEKSDSQVAQGNEHDGTPPTGFAAFVKKMKEKPGRFLICCALILCLLLGLAFSVGKIIKDDGTKYAKEVIRIYGEDRYDTSLKLADLLKESIGVSKFEAVIIINSQNYPDAISAACLAQSYNAPILLVSESTVGLITDYVKHNLQAQGTVYILGGTSAVPEDLENALLDFETVRLSGQNRYETNLLALKAANSNPQELVVCGSDAYADGLIAASLNKPVMLVNETLTNDQRAFLAETSSNLKIYTIGGTNAVSEATKDELAEYGTVIRISGTNRFETSVNVAQKFFKKPDYLFLIFTENYADGFSAIPLIIHKQAPLLVIPQSGTEFAVEYATFNGIQYGMIIGSEKFISDDIASDIFNLEGQGSILVNP